MIDICKIIKAKDLLRSELIPNIELAGTSNFNYIKLCSAIGDLEVLIKNLKEVNHDRNNKPNKIK